MLFIISVLACAAALTVYVGSKKRGRQQESLLAGISAAIAFAIASFNLVAVVPAGMVGVVDFMGLVNNNTLKPGINFVNPAANVIKFSVKTQEMKIPMQLPTKDGINLDAEISLLYSLDPDNASKMYVTVGPNYHEIVLEPQFRSVARGITAAYEANELFTAAPYEITSKIKHDLQRLVASRGIRIEAVAIRQIVFPQSIQSEIVGRLKAVQESQRLGLAIKNEQMEAERKRIEAEGIANYQTIISKGMTDNYLKWKGIEATEKLAKSQNTKVIVIGSGKSGLPLVLGN